MDFNIKCYDNIHRTVIVHKLCEETIFTKKITKNVFAKSDETFLWPTTLLCFVSCVAKAN